MKKFVLNLAITVMALCGVPFIRQLSADAMWGSFPMSMHTEMSSREKLENESEIERLTKKASEILNKDSKIVERSAEKFVYAGKLAKAEIAGLVNRKVIPTLCIIVHHIPEESFQTVKEYAVDVFEKFNSYFKDLAKYVDIGIGFLEEMGDKPHLSNLKRDFEEKFKLKISELFLKFFGKEAGSFPIDKDFYPTLTNVLVSFSRVPNGRYTSIVKDFVENGFWTVANKVNEKLNLHVYREDLFDVCWVDFLNSRLNYE